MFHCGFIRAAKRLFTGYLPRSGKPGLLLAPGGTHQAADDHERISLSLGADQRGLTSLAARIDRARRAILD